jgi:hypothetical protein
VKVENREAQLARILAGAAIGAGFAFLFLTKSGRHLLGSAEPWLDEVIRDMQRLRGTAAKAREAVDEGRRSFDAIAQLASFGPPADEPWSPEAKH